MPNVNPQHHQKTIPIQTITPFTLTVQTDHRLYYSNNKYWVT